MSVEQPKPSAQPSANRREGDLTHITSAGACLDIAQLALLEQSFRSWVTAASRCDVVYSRRRILLIFLLIRYSGAKLNEVLALDAAVDIDAEGLCIRSTDSIDGSCQRRIALSAPLVAEVRQLIDDAGCKQAGSPLFAIDPAFVRRKFYERAEACGIAKQMAGPEMIRRARAVELMQSNMPLAAVQKLLGHATPNQTAAHLSYSEEDLQRVTRFHLERESCRRTSARNNFFGKIVAIKRGDVQAQVSLLTPAGHRITTIITLESLDRLHLQEGRLLTAEVKAPWVMLQPVSAGACSADNRLQGEVVRINAGRVTTEYVVRIDDHTELCALSSTEGADSLSLQVGDQALLLFNCFAVILHD